MLGGLAVTIWVALAAVVLANLVYLPVLGQLDPGIHDVASLPGKLSLCGRSWAKGAGDHQLTLAQIVDQSGSAPVVVDTRPFAPCPAGACTASGSGRCATVIWVRVEEDAYVDYSLQGGP